MPLHGGIDSSGTIVDPATAEAQASQLAELQAIAGATAALAGSAYVLVDQPTPETVYALGLAAFPAILLGGFDSIIGALVGSLGLAFIQNLATYHLNGKWEDVVTYSLLLAVLLVRPQGLFGSEELTRL